jgi:hypothetical protein
MGRRTDSEQNTPGFSQELQWQPLQKTEFKKHLAAVNRETMENLK